MTAPEREPGDDTAESFPARLRRLRGEQGVSLAGLARRTHYSKGYLSKIETGSKRVTIDVARSCDQALRANGALLRLVENAEPDDGTASAAGSGVPHPRSQDVCPYPGLAAFTPHQARWFFGRESATAALVERIFARVGSGPVLLVAPSGAGKSSLLNAGLVPAFRCGDGFPMPGTDRWPVVRFTPTAHPLDELLDRTAKALGGELGVSVQDVRDRPDTLLEAVSERLDGTNDGVPANDYAPASDARASDDVQAGDPGREPPPARLVLIIDQFEEIFTLCSGEEERHSFVRVLRDLAASRPAAAGHRRTEAAVVVLGLRADFSGHCLALPELAAVFTEGLFVLPPMSVAELQESISRPAELAGVTLEPGLVELLLRDVGLREPPGASPAPPDVSGDVPAGTLPLVSHALMATWRRREGAALTVAGYEATGGIQGAVGRTAESVFARLYPSEQRAIRRVLMRLVHVADGTEATRRRMSRTALMEQLAHGDGGAAALDAFVRARLITMADDNVEIAHEALLRAWPRLRRWIGADRAGLLIHQQLSHAAGEWEHGGRDPSVLYRGTRLENARAWADDLDGRSRLTPLEAAFLRASQDEEDARREQARRQLRLRRSAVAALAVLLVLAMAAGSLAYQQRASALDQKRVARSQALAGQSTALAAGQPEASMALAAEAYRTEATAESRGALLSTQSQPFSARLGGHRGPVNAVAFAPGGRLLATAGNDGTVLLRRLTDHRTEAAFTVPGRVRSVAFSPDGRTLAVTSTDGPVRLWDTARRQASAMLPANTTGSRAVVFAPRGNTLATAASDGTIQLWDTAGNPRAVKTLTGHTGRVNTLAYAPDGRTLVSGGDDQSVRLWDPGRTRPLAVLEGHNDEVLAAAFAPDGRTVATGGVDRTVRLWDVASRRETATLTGHSDDINAVAYTPDGTTVVSAGGEGSTRLWDVRSARLAQTLTGHTDYVIGVAVSSSGTTLATAGFDQSVVLWDLHRSVLAARPFTEIWQAAYSPDARTLATANADHSVRLWDARTHQEITTFTGHRETVYSVAFSPDGRTLASGGSDRTIRLWDVTTHRHLATLTQQSGEVFSVAFSPDGRTLASGSSDHTIRLWDVSTRRHLATLTGHKDYVNDIAFSPDGQTLASASDDLTIRLWDPVRRTSAALTGHTGAVRRIAFSPDGRTLASSSNDGSVRLWETRQRRSAAVLTGHSGSVRGIAFSPDGRTLASSGNDRTVRLWTVAGRRLWATLTGHTSAVWGVTFSPAGGTVASSSSDGTVRLWNLDIRARLDATCRLRTSLPMTRWCEHR